METNIGILLTYFNSIFENITLPLKRGPKHKYSRASFIVFFIIMVIKRIHRFKSMHKYAQQHYRCFGWASCPTRKTIRVRFEALPVLLQLLIPEIAKIFATINKRFDFKWVFIDKSVFRALGGIWHTKHMKEGIVPHSSIDTEASWAKSDYHGWRFGYGLHLIVNQHRFPISACVSGASCKDYSFVESLISPIHHKVSIIVGDRGYFCAAVIEKIKSVFNILLQTIKPFEDSCKSAIKDWYNDLILTPQARWLYGYRKPSIEPTFAIIKEFFNLTNDNPLPFKGLNKVSAYLLTCTLTIQIMMYHNYLNNRKSGDTTAFKTCF